MATNIIGVGSLDKNAVIVLGVAVLIVGGILWYVFAEAGKIVDTVTTSVGDAVSPITDLENNAVSLVSHPLDYITGGYL